MQNLIGLIVSDVIFYSQLIHLLRILPWGRHKQKRIISMLFHVKIT